MPFGIRVSNGKFKGVSAHVKGKSLIVGQAFEGTLEGYRQKGTIVGLPLEEFFIKNITLPELSKKELDEAVKLQISSNLSFDESAAYVGYKLKKFQKGHGLLIVATPKKAVYKPKAILPEPLALYPLAMTRELLPPDKKSLILYMKGEEVFTLATEGHEVVFMRSFMRDEDFSSELRLSAQAVYLKEERSLLDIERVVIFGDYGECAEEIKSAFSVQSNPPEIIRSEVGTDGELLIPTGLALSAGFLKKLKGWNVCQRDVRYMDSIVKGLKYTIPLCPLFLLAYYYADLASARSALEGAKGRMKALSPVYEEVVKLEEEVTGLEQFFEKQGEGITSPDAWFQTIDVIEKSRPYGLWFTAISGKTSGTVLISGKAESYPLVTEFMKKLDASEKLSDLNLIFTQGSDDSVDFQISLNMQKEGDEI